MATLGISPQTISSAFYSQIVLTPAGSIDTKGPQVFICLDGAFNKLEKIRETPIVVQAEPCSFLTWQPLNRATKIQLTP